METPDKSDQLSKKIAIVMGSESDYLVMKDACEVLESLYIEHSVLIVSAHRTPDRMFTFAKNAKNDGYAVIIAGAGGAAHLPGMLASLTSVPVIGVPIRSSNLQGLDSLLSIVQMPKGIPVATMAINGAQNAALFAIAILGTYDSETYEKLHSFREKVSDSIPMKPLEYLEHIKEFEEKEKNAHTD